MTGARLGGPSSKQTRRATRLRSGLPKRDEHLLARYRQHHQTAHALHYGAVIVSANLEHFQATGAPVENWDEASR
jgi:hypothetical protein